MSAKEKESNKEDYSIEEHTYQHQQENLQMDKYNKFKEG